MANDIPSHDLLCGCFGCCSFLILFHGGRGKGGGIRGDQGRGLLFGNRGGGICGEGGQGGEHRSWEGVRGRGGGLLFSCGGPEIPTKFATIYDKIQGPVKGFQTEGFPDLVPG